MSESDLPEGRIDFIASCVGASAAVEVGKEFSRAIAPGGLLFDWNTMPSDQKRAVEEASSCDVIDVALLGSVDVDESRPLIAISGPTVDTGRAILEELELDVRLAGTHVGDAAQLKQVRSIFMKSFEALVLEYTALTRSVDEEAIVTTSLEHSLGSRCVEFMDMLLVTNQLHGERRAAELAKAVEVLGTQGASLRIAPAAVSVLERAAEIWELDAAPEPGSGSAAVSRYLAEVL